MQIVAYGFLSLCRANLSSFLVRLSHSSDNRLVARMFQSMNLDDPADTPDLGLFSCFLERFGGGTQVSLCQCLMLTEVGFVQIVVRLPVGYPVSITPLPVFLSGRKTARRVYIMEAVVRFIRQPREPFRRIQRELAYTVRVQKITVFDVWCFP